MPGFVKIPRDITNFSWYTDANTVKVYVHLLLKASWTTRVWNGIVLQPGQVAISQETLAAELKLTRIKVRTALRNLIESGIVAKVIANTAANGLANGLASKIANGLANRCTVLNVYSSADFEGANFNVSQYDSQPNSQQKTGCLANGLAGEMTTNVEYIEEEYKNIPPSNTLYYCPPKGVTCAKEYDNPQVRTDSVIPNTEGKKKVARKKKEADDAEEAEVLTWRNDFQTYLQECREAWKRWVNDPQWMDERRKFNPGVDILLTLEKACKEFWATEAGWVHKKRQRSKTIDWKRTFESAISNKNNRVYEQRNSSNGPQSGGGIEDALRAAADGIRRARTKQPWESDDQPFAGADGVGWSDPGFGR